MDFLLSFIKIKDYPQHRQVCLTMPGRGWQIPEKISVAGIGDANIASLVHPGLTTIKILGRKIGERSAEILLERMQGFHDLAIQEDIGFQLVVRGSTK